MSRKYELNINDMTVKVEVDGPHNGVLNITIGETIFPVKVAPVDYNAGTFKAIVGDVKHIIHLIPSKDTSQFMCTIKNQSYSVELRSHAPIRALEYRPTPLRAIPASTMIDIPSETLAVQEVTEPGSVTAPLPGRILEVRVKEGERVKAGDVLLVLEAMKMANEIRASQDGLVSTLHIKDGDTVEKGQALITIK